MGYVDCDSHVIESEETWEYFDPTEVNFRPIKLRVETPQIKGVGSPFSELWIANDDWAGVLPGNGSPRGNGNRFDEGATRLTDPSKRIADLDVLGIDVQMLYTTFFLTLEIRNPAAEAAIKRSWNRWMAEKLHGTEGRLVWTVEAPMRQIPRAIEEIEFGKAHGAAGVRLHGVENGCYLNDPVFYPFYERAQDLDLAIVIHLGRPNKQSAAAIPIGTQFPTFAPYVEHLAGPMTAFFTVLVSDLHKRFPRLRFVMSEAGATWTHALVQQYQRTMASTVDFKIKPLDPSVFEEKNLFITCQSDEDLPRLTELLGETVLVAGTDYSHNDVSSQLNVHRTLLRRTDISEMVAEKIVDVNGRRAWAVSPDFRPSDASVNGSGEHRLPFTQAFEPAFAGPLGVVGIGE